MSSNAAMRARVRLNRRNDLTGLVRKDWERALIMEHYAVLDAEKNRRERTWLSRLLRR